MPVLAMRLSGAAQVREPVRSHLAAEFGNVPVHTVHRCVDDVWACAEHLGIEATPEIVARIAREHLLAMVNSAPPGR
jgi:hypothetical protein